MAFPSPSPLALGLLAVVLLGLPVVQAHSGHTSIEISHDIDGRLWAHIIFMSLAYGILFPIGTILGLVHHKLHVPIQALGGVFVVVGYFLGHFHQGRHFGENAHVDFSRLVLLAFFIQAGCGIYLKLHLERRLRRDYLRPILKPIHRYLGLATMLLAWVQILLGFIALTGFCYADHFGQCLAHFIMGSSFVWYGVWLLFTMTLAGPWLRSKGRSPEFYDSALILVWGIVNTFTEHRWNEPWNHKDLQHTAMGILWWAGGLVGVLSTWRLPPTSRSMFPALVILFTGLAMASHHQHTAFSTTVHAYFGGALCISAITRMIELCLLSQDKYQNHPEQQHPFQFVPAFFLVLSGTMFMSAQEESIHNLIDMGVDPASYCLLIVSVAFFLFLMAYSLMVFYRWLKPQESDLGYRAVGPEAGLDHPGHTGPAYSSGSFGHDTETHTQTIFDIASNDSFDDDPQSAVTLREEVEMGHLRSTRASPPLDREK